MRFFWKRVFQVLIDHFFAIAKNVIDKEEIEIGKSIQNPMGKKGGYIDYSQQYVGANITHDCLTMYVKS